MSFTRRIKIFSLLTENFLKLETLYCGFDPVFTRTLVTNNVLLNQNFIKQIDSPERRKSLSASKNLGEIIDLTGEFDEVQVDSKKSKNKRIIIEKNLKLDNNANDDCSIIKTEMNDSIHVQKKNNVEEAGKNTVIKGKFSDLKKNSRMLSSIMIKLRSNKVRKKEQKIILEGKRLIHDAISAGFCPSKVFYSRISDLEKLGLPENVPTFRVPFEDFNLWSNIISPQGIMAIFETPKLNKLKKSDNTLPLTIICDSIRDPGNLGSILRIAAGVGCEKLILIKGCADIWESKVLRAGAGAHFRLPVLNNLQWSDIKSEISDESKVILADFSSCLACNEAFDGKSDSGNQTSNFRSKNKMSESLPIYCYYSVKFGKKRTVIIVGGETYGISNEAYEFGIERKGIRVYIPMNNEIESLNNSVALGILTYEFRRQFEFASGKEIPLQKEDSDNSKNESW